MSAADAAPRRRWNPARLPRQPGRVFVVTGGNAGLGYFTVEQLAKTGARIILASRSKEKADAAIASVRRRTPDADLGFVRLDLASMESVREVGEYLGGVEKLDGLVLNAGMTSGSRERQETADGNELTLQSNYLGHFALTALAMPALQRGDAARVVGLGSIVTRLVGSHLDDLQSTRRFEFFRAYGITKHAAHGFVFELDRRLRAAGSSVSAVLAHPGFSLDGLSAARPGIVTDAPSERALAVAAQGKNRGAAPTVAALLDPSVWGSDFIGPRGVLKGRPRLARPISTSASPEFGRRLWRLSEESTGVPFVIGDRGAWPLRG